MKIAVCFKVTPDLERALPGDWDDILNARGAADFGRSVINCFDESALELALRIKDGAEGGGCICAAVTRADSVSSAVAKRLYAAGFDTVTRIEGGGEFVQPQTARDLARYLRAFAPDLILTGRQAGCADSGLVPAYLAELLGLPFIPRIRTIDLVNGAFRVAADTDSGVRTFDVRGAFVAAAGGSAPSALRVSTLRAQLAAAKRTVEEVRLADDAAAAAPAAPEFALRRPENARHCRMLTETGAARQAAALRGVLDTAQCGGEGRSV
jgi:electron transfer flavoprotein beta subunit